MDKDSEEERSLSPSRNQRKHGGWSSYHKGVSHASRDWRGGHGLDQQDIGFITDFSFCQRATRNFLKQGLKKKM